MAEKMAPKKNRHSERGGGVVGVHNRGVAPPPPVPWAPNKGDKIRTGCLTPAFSGVTSKIWHIPNAQEALKTQLWKNKLVKKRQK